jgi:soluble lytic murein transglycosylase-like protein
MSYAVVVAESGFNPESSSTAGAVGLMQIMPATAQRYGAGGGVECGEQADRSASQHLDRNALI